MPPPHQYNEQRGSFNGSVFRGGFNERGGCTDRNNFNQRGSFTNGQPQQPQRRDYTSYNRGNTTPNRSFPANRGGFNNLPPRLSEGLVFSIKVAIVIMFHVTAILLVHLSIFRPQRDFSRNWRDPAPPAQENYNQGSSWAPSANNNRRDNRSGDFWTGDRSGQWNPPSNSSYSSRNDRWEETEEDRDWSKPLPRNERMEE